MDIMNRLLFASGTLKNDLECYGQDRIRTPTIDTWGSTEHEFIYHYFCSMVSVLFCYVPLWISIRIFYIGED
ncbi:hypothetical protein DW036_08210 [Bacteroides sp. AF39-11AC]|jgi:predicted DNA-binding helix-hairpin-helix protein|nr:hypothetical protein DW036_08210 [Bacteroides sp. AF39-11AC]